MFVGMRGKKKIRSDFDLELLASLALNYNGGRKVGRELAKVKED